jgi:hypothetical protein
MHSSFVLPLTRVVISQFISPKPHTLDLPWRRVNLWQYFLHEDKDLYLIAEQSLLSFSVQRINYIVHSLIASYLIYDCDFKMYIQPFFTYRLLDSESPTFTRCIFYINQVLQNPESTKSAWLGVVKIESTQNLTETCAMSLSWWKRHVLKSEYVLQ